MADQKTCKSDRVRRVAAHHVIVDGNDRGLSVVVYRTDGTVLDIHPLSGEEPFTEWHGGTLVIQEIAGCLHLTGVNPA